MNDKKNRIKIKIKIKNDLTIAKVKVPLNFVVNTNQSNLLFKKYNYGFFKLNSYKKNKFEFIGANETSLYDRLKEPICEIDFFIIVEQILDATQKIEKIGLSCNNFVFDEKCVFINESTNELSFIYLPIATPHSNIGVFKFIKQVVNSEEFIETGSECLSEFAYFINEIDESKDDIIDKVKMYISNVCIHSNIDGDVSNSFLNKKNPTECKPRNKTYTSAFDDEPTDIMSDNDKTDIFDDEATDIFSNNVQIGLQLKQDNVADENTCLLDNESTELFSDDEMTDLFDKNSTTCSKFPTLIRTLTEEVIRINKPVFRIGKEENCVDYIVTNNIAISRSHADIISRSGKYYVFDLRSKNKSYINNRVLPTEHEIEIFNGDVLKLANEEFIFQV